MSSPFRHQDYPFCPSNALFRILFTRGLKQASILARYSLRISALVFFREHIVT